MKGYEWFGQSPGHEALTAFGLLHFTDMRQVRDVDTGWRWPRRPSPRVSPRRRIDVPLSLVAAVPGTYTGPSSRAYLDSADEHKTWSEGVKVSIAPKP